MILLESKDAISRLREWYVLDVIISIQRYTFLLILETTLQVHMYFFPIILLLLICTLSWSGIQIPDQPPFSNASLPAGVISPRSSRSMHLSMFSFVQWLFFLLGDNRCAKRPSGSFFKVLSIHPKHNASSTTSR